MANPALGRAGRSGLGAVTARAAFATALGHVRGRLLPGTLTHAALRVCHPGGGAWFAQVLLHSSSREGSPKSGGVTLSPALVPLYPSLSRLRLTNFSSAPSLGGGTGDNGVIPLGFPNGMCSLSSTSVSSGAATASLCFGCICLINLGDVDNWAQFNFANLRNDQANLVHI